MKVHEPELVSCVGVVMTERLSLDATFRSESEQFKHFGVLDNGKQSRSSLFTATVLNVLIALLVLLLGAAAKKTIDDSRKMTILTLPTLMKEPEPLRPRIIPKPLPRPPVVKIEPPKIKTPDVPKPAVVKMSTPAPVLAPAPPKKVTAPAAPQVVNLSRPAPAAVVNNSPHPSAIALGRVDNPIAPSNRPAVSTVDLGQRGMAGMPASNTGGGPPSTRVSLGSGSPGSQSLSENGVRSVQGVRLGVSGGTGSNSASGRQVGQVNLGRSEPPATARQSEPIAARAESGPKVLYKPTPAYTAEATALHISGSVSLRIRVSAAGSVSILEVTNGLGHGLDESARHAILGTRFSPALDVTGHPIDWEGVVRINFQLAG